MAPSARRRLGTRTERIAAWRLFWRGYRFLERNWTCSRGEVDLIARHRGKLVFIEVKSRTGDGRRPEDQVGYAKQRRLCRLADRYRREKQLWHLGVRFDVVAIVLDARGRVRDFRLWVDAFEYIDP